MGRDRFEGEDEIGSRIVLKLFARAADAGDGSVRLDGELLWKADIELAERVRKL